MDAKPLTANSSLIETHLLTIKFSVNDTSPETHRFASTDTLDPIAVGEATDNESPVTTILPWTASTWTVVKEARPATDRVSPRNTALLDDTPALWITDARVTNDPPSNESPRTDRLPNARSSSPILTVAETDRDCPISTDSVIVTESSALTPD